MPQREQKTFPYDIVALTLYPYYRGSEITLQEEYIACFLYSGIFTYSKIKVARIIFFTDHPFSCLLKGVKAVNFVLDYLIVIVKRRITF